MKRLLSVPDNASDKLEALLHKYRWVLGGAGALVLLVFPLFGFSQYIMRILILIAIYTMLALGLNILTGYTGMLSLGHAGFYAIGAYTGALLMLRLEWNFFAALAAATVLTGLCGLLLGFPTLRLTGTYLSIVTLGFCEVVRMVIMNWDPVTNGTLGLRSIPVPTLFGHSLTLSNHGLYYLALVLLALVSVCCVVIINSKIGRAFLAIKADELTASLMGIPTTRYKILSFVLSAAVSGLAGGFYASLIGYIDHNSFTFDVSILIVSIVILGGMGTVKGMYLGAALLIVFPEVARPFMEWRFVVYGLVLVLMMHFRPQGLLGRRSRLPYPFPRLARERLQARARSKDEPQKGEAAGITGAQ